MFKAIVNRIFKGERGFTLIELLVVMSIMAVLAGVVSTLISGTGATSRDAAAVQDANTTQTAATQYFTDRTVDNPDTEQVELVTTVNEGTRQSEGVEQTIASLWPEAFITAADEEASSIYFHEFDDSAPADVVDVVLILNDDQTSPTLLTETTLLQGYTAVDFDKLLNGYMDKEPSSIEDTTEVTDSIEVFTYLWLFKKSTTADASAGGDTNDSRSVAVFKLTEILETAGGDDSLVYVQMN